MQLQMEVCDLDECDFLETKFTEYENFKEFCDDGNEEKTNPKSYLDDSQSLDNSSFQDKSHDKDSVRKISTSAKSHDDINHKNHFFFREKNS